MFKVVKAVAIRKEPNFGERLINWEFPLGMVFPPLEFDPTNIAVNVPGPGPNSVTWYQYKGGWIPGSHHTTDAVYVEAVPIPPAPEPGADEIVSAHLTLYYKSGAIVEKDLFP